MPGGYKSVGFDSDMAQAPHLKLHGFGVLAPNMQDVTRISTLQALYRHPLILYQRHIPQYSAGQNVDFYRYYRPSC